MMNKNHEGKRHREFCQGVLPKVGGDFLHFGRPFYNLNLDLAISLAGVYPCGRQDAVVAVV